MNHAHASAEPFFLDTGAGRRFCMFHPAAPAMPCRGAVLYIAPFGDEMNKSRRMAALQARRLSALGYAVLQPDLHGCGDSAGELAEASLALWRADLAAAAAWLRERGIDTIYLLGLRLGGLLALDFAQAGAAIAGIALWQPVLNGESFLVQLLRQKLASGMLADGDNAGGTAALRESLRGGETLEIGGYDIAPGLADGIASLDAATLAPPACPVAWFAVGSAVPPAASRIAGAWQGAEVSAVAGAPFWSTQEIHQSEELLAATSAWFAARTA
ncbi:MAG: hydrolase 2, exosortase A system-associated [Telluria sp.]